MQSLIGAQSEHQFQDRRIGSNALAVLDAVDETGRRHDFEALVDADKKLRWNRGRLNRAELCAFDLTWNRAQLARRIDLAFDAAARILLDRRGEVFGELVRRIVDGRQGHLHHVSLVFGPCGAARQSQRQGQRAGGRHRPRRSFNADKNHVALPLVRISSKRKLQGNVCAGTSAGETIIEASMAIAFFDAFYLTDSRIR